MTMSKDEVQTMIMEHIRKINFASNKYNITKENEVQLANAKSTALLALAQITNS